MVILLAVLALMLIVYAMVWLARGNAVLAGWTFVAAAVIGPVGIGLVG